jgi:hypothetical protein
METRPLINIDENGVRQTKPRTPLLLRNGATLWTLGITRSKELRHSVNIARYSIGAHPVRSHLLSYRVGSTSKARDIPACGKRDISGCCDWNCSIPMSDPRNASRTNKIYIAPRETS